MAVSLGAALIAPVAAGQDVAAAEALFREGRALLDRGELEAACAKLASSQRLDASAGTLLNLASCHERQGKNATAWAEYLAAARLAQAQGKQDKVAEGKKRAAALEPTLSYVVITLARPVAGISIKRDGTELDAGALGSRIPVDPGPHELVASAPGFETATVKFEIGKSPEVKSVSIPGLQESRAPGPARPPPAPSAPALVTSVASAPSALSPMPPPPARASHTLAYVVGGLGVAATIVGGTFGILAMNAYSKAKDDCPTRTGCSPEAMSQHDTASSRATIANVGIGVGLVGIAAGVVLFFTSGRPETARPTATIVPQLHPNQAGLALTGAF